MQPPESVGAILKVPDLILPGHPHSRLPTELRHACEDCIRYAMKPDYNRRQWRAVFSSWSANCWELAHATNTVRECPYSDQPVCNLGASVTAGGKVCSSDAAKIRPPFDQGRSAVQYGSRESTFKWVPRQTLRRYALGRFLRLAFL